MRWTSDDPFQIVQNTFSAVHMVVVRPYRFQDQNEAFITGSLCKPSTNYYKVYTDKFEEEMDIAGCSIMNNMDYKNDGNLRFLN